jgi:acyl carrier protein
LRLEDELKTIILRELKLEDVDPSEIEDDTPLFYEGLGLDSLDSLELIVIMRNHYGVHIKDRHEARQIFTSVRTMADCIRAHQGEQAERE